MSEYFRGWRRKFGAVTLVLACIASAEWIRSFYRVEAILFCPASSFVCATFGHGIMLFSCFTFATHDTALSTSGVSLSPLSAINLGWSSEIIAKPPEKIEPWGDAQAESHFQWGQFICGISSHTIQAKTAIYFEKRYIAAPFWSLVIPLTAVSAWLLLSQRKQGKNMIGISRFFFTAMLGVALIPSHSLCAFGDDEETTPQQRQREKRFDENLFDSKRDHSVSVMQTRLMGRLAQRIEVIDRVSNISNDQKKKLDVIGRAAIKGLLRNIEDQKKSFLATERSDLEAARFVYENPDICDLRKQIRNGPFGEDSLFAKALPNVLTAEQEVDLKKPSVAETSQRIDADNARFLVRSGKRKKFAYRIELKPDGTQISDWEYNKAVEFYSLSSESLVRSLGNKITGFDCHWDSGLAAIVEQIGIVTLIDLASGKERKLNTDQQNISVKLSPDGQVLVTASYSGPKAKLWSSSTLEIIREFDVGKVEGALTPTFSPDGKRLAIGNRNSTTLVFDVVTGALLHELPHRMSHELRFDPTGSTLAVTYVNGHLILWDMETGRLKHSARAWADELYTVDWSPDGSMLATGGYNTPVTIWDPATLKILSELDSPEWVMSVRFSPDSTKLIFAGHNRPPEDRYIETWAIPEPRK